MQQNEPDNPVAEELALKSESNAADANLEKTRIGQDTSDLTEVYAGDKSAGAFVGKLLNGRFKLETLVGEGGMSYVYRAKDVLLNKTVAVKMLRPHHLHDPQSVRRLHKEAIAASALDHPNTAGIKHFDFTEDGLPFIVMDFLHGKSLAEMISREGAFDSQRAVFIIRQIAMALDHAHAKGIVHRDLKPSNVVLLNEQDRLDVVKVVDFGIAKIATADGEQLSHLTKTGEIFGSPIVMSPEQCRGGQVDARSDIYSLGCLMYEMLTGQPVFESKNTMDLLFKQLNEMPNSFKQANESAKIAPELEAITFKALQKNPENRYKSMTELINELDSLDRKTILESVKTRVALAASNKRRNDLIAKIIAGVVACSVLVIGGGYYGGKQLYGDDVLLATIFPWQIDSVPKASPRTTDAAQVRRIAESTGRMCPYTPGQIEEHPPSELSTEPAARQLLVKLCENAQALSKVGATRQLCELSAKIDALAVLYGKRDAKGADQKHVVTVIGALSNAGNDLLDLGATEQARCTYAAAQAINDAFQGPDSADDQFFCKLIGDCIFKGVVSGQRPLADYERAYDFYVRALASKDDFRLVDRARFRFIGPTDFGPTNDLSSSPLIWDTHRKRAQCAYQMKKYRSAKEDFDWVFGHRLIKSLPDAEEALLCWQAADCERVSLGDADSEQMANQAVQRYATGKGWLPNTHATNIALSNIYIAAIGDQYKIAKEQLPPGSIALPDAVASIQKAFGGNQPVAILSEKQLASSLWRQGKVFEAAGVVLDVIGRKLHIR